MSRASLAKSRKVVTSSSCRSYRPSSLRMMGATSTVPTACLPLPFYLKKTNDHHIPLGCQCLDTFLILQACGTGPHSPPQPLSNALSLLGPCREVPTSGWTSALSLGHTHSTPVYLPAPGHTHLIPVYSSGFVRFPFWKNLIVGYPTTPNSLVSSGSAGPSTLAKVTAADSAASRAAALLYSGASALQ